jgi:hypothetical protein
VIDRAFWDGQLSVTIKKSIPKIITTLNRIADSYLMSELKLILCDGLNGDVVGNQIKSILGNLATSAMQRW